VFAAALTVFGIGVGMVLTSVNVGIQAIAKVGDCAMAASMYTFFRSLGMPLGIVLSGAIFQNVMKSKLSLNDLLTEVAHDSKRYVYVLQAMALGNPNREVVLEAFLDGFRGVFILMTEVAVTALAASLFIKR
jgi:hypothetical protein